MTDCALSFAAGLSAHFLIDALLYGAAFGLGWKIKAACAHSKNTP
jgi:hypothetical protein